jgi:hypothetical protein
VDEFTNFIVLRFLFEENPGASLIVCKLPDSAYTERYMGLPNVTDNYKGYDEADVSKKAHLLKDKMFYLVHGSADDNVHLQQSMALVKSLSQEGTLFRQLVILVGVSSRRHV